MYIALKTINVWEIAGHLDERQFFSALPSICEPNDVLVIGSYATVEPIRKWLVESSLSIPKKEKPFNDYNYEINKDEYPFACAYCFHPTEDIIEKLVAFLEIPMGGVEKDTFFDDVLLYRPGVPDIPLFDFHDAFRGPLRLSEFYSKKQVESFVNMMNAQATLVKNGEYFDVVAPTCLKCGQQEIKFDQMKKLKEALDRK